MSCLELAHGVCQVNILFDVAHPAHVHLFRVARTNLIGRGHTVFMVAREKDVTRQLLEAYRIPYFQGTSIRPGKKRFIEMMEWVRNDWRIIRDNAIDLVASTASIGPSWAARSMGIPHLSFADTEVSNLMQRVVRPATAQFFTPRSFLKDLGPKHSRYNGTHDLAYMRPEHFTPDPSVKAELGVGDNEPYVVMRFVGWDAHHDWSRDKPTVEAKNEIVALTAERCKVFISAEGKLPDHIEPMRMRIKPHRAMDAMAYASALITDGTTMATEASVLGVPALRIAPCIDELGVVHFWWKEFKLMDTFEPKDYAADKVKAFLDNPRLEERAAERERMLAGTIDVAAYIADRCEEYGDKRARR